MTTLRYLPALFAALLICVSAQAQTPVNPVGEWAYTLETPEGGFNGVITIAESEGALRGVISSDLGDPLTLQNVRMSNDTLYFQATGEFGVMTGTAVLNADALQGQISLADFGSFPIRGSRRPANNDTGAAGTTTGNTSAAAPATDASTPAAAPEPEPAQAALSTRTVLRTLFANPAARAVLDKHMPGFTTNPEVEQGMDFSLREIADFVPDLFPEALLQAIDADLAKL
jgi:hypothetical protein